MALKCMSLLQEVQIHEKDKNDFELFDVAIKTVCESILKNPNKKLKSEKIEYSLKEYAGRMMRMFLGELRV